MIRIRPATTADADAVFTLICELAEYERLTHEVVATEESLRATLFAPGSSTSALIAEAPDGEPVGFAVYFRPYSTFLGREGIYLEDLFVRPAYRGQGIGGRGFRQ